MTRPRRHGPLLSLRGRILLGYAVLVAGLAFAAFIRFAP